jgi:NAD(P)-dependent dehydrogenase (short-subunit alcohol dehydrogenase family)
VDESERLSKGCGQVKEMPVNSDVIVIICAGGIGQAIAWRQGLGKIVLLADASEQVLAEASASLKHASYNIQSQLVDVTSKISVRALADKAAALGNVGQVINTAGLSPNMASVQKILEVDLYGVALVFDEGQTEKWLRLISIRP